MAKIRKIRDLGPKIKKIEKESELEKGLDSQENNQENPLTQTSSKSIAPILNPINSMNSRNEDISKPYQPSFRPSPLLNQNPFVNDEIVLREIEPKRLIDIRREKYSNFESKRKTKKYDWE